MLANSHDQPHIISIENISDEAVGGKARGLAELVAMGLQVPQAFVIVNAEGTRFPLNLDHAYAELGGGRVAVRSSALGEDGDQASFAGQYETVLDVEGEADLRQAITRCVDSLHSERADAYNEDQAQLGDVRMCVVVQQMVAAASAGVLFSADPVTGRHDRMVIDAVTGLGEALVSGEQTPDHYLLDRDNQLVLSDLVDVEPILSPLQIKTLAEQARAAVVSHGAPLDMEWAFDADGQLFWLQARPITTLGVDLNDNYTPIAADAVITRCNVGEMMPGPVCPLTFSTQGRAIEHGMQHMHVSYARRPAITQDWTQINLFYGHMFINLSGGLAAARNVSLTNAEVMAQTLCGRPVPELQEPLDKRPLPQRWWGSVRFLRYCLRASKVLAEFYTRFENFNVVFHDSSLQMMEEMELQFPWLLEADEVHLRSSAYSGLMEGVIQGIVSGGIKNPNPEQAAALQGEAARLLAGAENVESAVMLQQLDQVVDLIAVDAEQGQWFRKCSTEEGLAWLESEPAAAAGSAFRKFLDEHGHRGYRELCVREKAWREQPQQVVTTMQAAIASRLNGAYRPKAANSVDMTQLSLALRKLLPAAHKAIRQREETKSMLVEATYRLKRGYRHLGDLLVNEGHLEDADLVYFFSREELADYCRAPNPEAAERAVLRRRTLEFQQHLEFEDIHVGFASPIELQEQTTADANQLVGRPVSRGVVEGRARVALTLEQAAGLQPGEILVSHITDIGWTPYFSLIAGLATDVGSAVSHGAVIAREYGLPAIVNLRTATKAIQTGDLIRLDADHGVLTRLASADETV
ncbi:pyruvate, water dikinase [Halieaceae bacterium IMCC14734]|uniref:Pyruvate, water dikinase n=1 Tax=Candidatus Litorirhabdus singularis TaxID=2518993 RepID=A0ABT3TL17_9GAMM|nr:PEP/pyruvate-binding domain-containing protein [Candidatus Litorirhabdus singularis]MCX2983019.1 pyruvate, water dikinase [Candidatus Litorirhabdus singularis]